MKRLLIYAVSAALFADSVKFHVFRGPNAGTESCDFRGGEETAGDIAHRTIPQLEVDPAPEALVQKILEVGPELNEIFKEIGDHQPDVFGAIASALGLEGEGPVGLRVGVWDQ